MAKIDPLRMCQESLERMLSKIEETTDSAQKKRAPNEQTFNELFQSIQESQELVEQMDANKQLTVTVNPDLARKLQQAANFFKNDAVTQQQQFNYAARMGRVTKALSKLMRTLKQFEERRNQKVLIKVVKVETDRQK